MVVYRVGKVTAKRANQNRARSECFNYLRKHVYRKTVFKSY